MFRALVLAGLVLAVAAADEISGPLRLTLATESWGTIFYLPAELKDYDYTPDPNTGLRTMKGKLGTVTIEDTGIGSYRFNTPKGKFTVESTEGRVKVDFFGQKYDFAHVKAGETDQLVVTVPGDRVVYDLGRDEIMPGGDHRHLITVNGRHGQMTITETDGDYTVKSSKGTYSYSVTPGGGFKVRGAPLVNFPYMYRGAIFKAGGVGVFVDFKKMEPDSPIFRYTEWQPMMVFSK